jgi:hypothetical protein
MTLAVRQHAVVGSNALGYGTVVFGLAPSNGNLLLAILAAEGSDTSITAGTGWTKQYSNSPGAGEPQQVVVYSKYAGSSESTTQSPTGTIQEFNGYSLEVWEISGVTGTWATDFREEWHATNQAATPTITTAAHNTAAANQLVLSLVAGEITWYKGTQGGAPTVGSNGQTNDDLFYNDTFGTVSYPAHAASHITIAGSGTNYQLAVTFNANQNSAAYQFVSLNSSSPGETGTAALAFAGVGFSATVGDSHTLGGSMAFAGVGFSATVGDSHTLGGSMAFAGVGFSSAAADAPAPGSAHMNFSGVAFSATITRQENAGGSLAFKGISIAAHSVRTETSAAGMHFAGITIYAAGLRLGLGGSGVVHFWTFGA